MMSTDRAGKGSDSAVPSLNSAPGTRPDAHFTIASDGSIPVACRAIESNAFVERPAPQPTSSAFSTGTGIDNCLRARSMMSGWISGRDLA
jgi:hypothetical protein